MSPEDFKQNIETAGYVLDPKGVHHRLASGLHGQKLDFDRIPEDNELFDQWIDTLAEAVFYRYPIEDYPRDKFMLVSVANGTNRVVPRLADAIYEGAGYTLTKKTRDKDIVLAEGQSEFIEPGSFALVMEDVATTGASAASVVNNLRQFLPAEQIEVMVTWQRMPELTRLIGIAAVHNSLIRGMLPTLSPQECNKTGPCREGWGLIENN